MSLIVHPVSYDQSRADAKEDNEVVVQTLRSNEADRNVEETHEIGDSPKEEIRSKDIGGDCETIAEASGGCKLDMAAKDSNLRNDLNSTWEIRKTAENMKSQILNVTSAKLTTSRDTPIPSRDEVIVNIPTALAVSSTPCTDRDDNEDDLICRLKRNNIVVAVEIETYAELKRSSIDQPLTIISTSTNYDQSVSSSSSGEVFSLKSVH